MKNLGKLTKHQREVINTIVEQNTIRNQGLDFVTNLFIKDELDATINSLSEKGWIQRTMDYMPPKGLQWYVLTEDAKKKLGLS